jgi:hypothetical protein
LKRLASSTGDRREVRDRERHGEHE